MAIAETRWLALLLCLSACPGGQTQPTATDTEATNTEATDAPTTSDATTNVATTTAAETSGGPLECAPGELRACYSHPDPDTADHAPCHAGSQTCSPEGAWGPCEGEVLPGAEDCASDVDEDCDGLPPAQDPDCGCAPGATEACAVADALGECAAGQRACAQDMTWGPCQSLVAPDPGKCALEWTDQKDHDCDGDTSCGEHEWSARFGGPKEDGGGGVAVGPQGDLWLGGGFAAAIDLGGGALTAVDASDAFVARFAADGSHVWSRRYGGLRDQAVTALRIDDAGDVVVGGAFHGPIDLGGEPFLTEWDLPSTFLAKLTPAGDHVWSTAAQGHTQMLGMVLDDLGAPVLTGYIRESTSFGDVLLTPSGPDDAYLARFDADTGALQSARAYGEGDNQDAFGVAFGPDLGVAFTGGFNGVIDVDGVKLGTDDATSDVFVICVDADGNHRWSRVFGGSSWDFGTGVALAPGGDLLLVGVFEESIDLGGGALVSAGDRDLFVARLDGDGNHLWSRRFGDEATQQYVKVAVDARGDIVLFGAFSGTLDFGGGPLTSAGGLDLFVAKLDALGEHVWSRRAGDAAEQFATDVAFDASGRVLVTGRFEGKVDLGGGELTSAGGSDVFVARFLP